MQRFLRDATLGVGTLLASCAVGPNYRPPAPPASTGYASPGALAPSTQAVALPGGEAQRFVDGLDIPGQWWTLFHSSELNALVDQALAHNPTLESAQASLRQARETALAARGALFPSLSAAYQAEREEVSGTEFGLPSFPSSTSTLNSASLSISYTIDVFGGVRRQIEANEAQADAQRFVLEASYLTLTANLVTAAITEASLREQIAATEKLAHDQETVLAITKTRLTVGAASLADVLLQQSNLEATLANLPPLRTQLAEERNLIAAYVGVLPADYGGPAFTLDSLTLPAELPVSIPSKLLEQRPDVRQDAALLHQAAAQVGVATANMLPQFTLTGSLGSDALGFGTLVSANTAVWNAIGGATQPLFKGGQLRHQRRAAVAAAQAAAANYKATVIAAFQNVSNALHALHGDADALAAYLRAERTAAQSLALVEAQYKVGGASFLQVLIAEQSYQNALIALVKARAQRFADTAALFQALGGGWWNRSDVGAPVESPIPAASFGATRSASGAPPAEVAANPRLSPTGSP